jgi:hypothetical protein
MIRASINQRLEVALAPKFGKTEQFVASFNESNISRGMAMEGIYQWRR